MREKRTREVLELLKHNEETGIDYYKTKLNCKKGHDLRQFRGNKGGSTNCSNCPENNLNMHKYYYRCNECDYNLCHGCVFIQGKILQKTGQKFLFH
jgi:hypothetical protein